MKKGREEVEGETQGREEKGRARRGGEGRAGGEGDQASDPSLGARKDARGLGDLQACPAAEDARSVSLFGLFLSPPNNPPCCPRGPVCSLERLLLGCQLLQGWAEIRFIFASPARTQCLAQTGAYGTSANETLIFDCSLHSPVVRIPYGTVTCAGKAVQEAGERGDFPDVKKAQVRGSHMPRSGLAPPAPRPLGPPAPRPLSLILTWEVGQTELLPALAPDARSTAEASCV